ncbi:MAG TPA: efflux RND transporter permease subunit [Gemmatimonadaceae bacterium]|nr:efflux RND transporter permease subunit [Gemmatimonadaceae bacterium]
MNDLFGLLIRQRRFVYLTIAGLSAAGIWAGMRMPSAIYPELQFPRVVVVAQGSALGARQIAFSLTRPIEQAVSIVPGVTRVRSRSIRGSSEVDVTFLPSTDMNIALQQTQQRVAQVALPPGIVLQVERLTPSIFPILSYNLEGGDAAALYDIARYQIVPVLSRIPGIGRVEAQGSAVREIEVIADPSRLSAAGLTYGDLGDAISRAITPAAVGRVARDYKQFLVVTDLEAHTPEDVGAVVVRPGVRVRDLASVQLGTEDRVSMVTGNGRPAALINISRQPGASTLAVADSVAKTMSALQRTLPSGAVLRPVYDQAALVRESVASVRDAMLIGAALAVVVLLVFLRHGRITAVSATAIPLTMAITVFVMWATGESFNLMSLGAMAIAIGLVIDDAVVVVENIARHLAMGGERRAAIRDALQELIWPVTSSTITTVVVFLPLGLLQGVVGQFFKTLSLTLTIAVLVSLVLALSIIPLLSEQFVKESDSEDAPEAPGSSDPASAAASSRATPHRGALARIGAGVGRALDRITDGYDRALAGALQRPVAIVAAMVLLGGTGYLLFRSAGTGFLPEMDEGAFVFDYFAPGGTALAETDRQVHVAEQIMLRTPEIQAISRRTGAELGLFATQQNRGDLVARLVPRSQRSRSIFEIMDQLRSEIAAAAPRLRIDFIQLMSDIINDLAGAATPVEVKLFGEDLNSLEQYAARLTPPMQRVAGLADFYNGVSESSAEMLLRVDAAAASQVGVTADQVGAAVSGALLGVNAGSIRTQDRAIAVRVRAPDSVRFDPARIQSLPVAARAGAPATPLGAVATMRDTSSRAELLRENQRQMIAMTAQVDRRSLGAVIGDVQRVLKANPPPAGVTVEIGGQYANQQESFKALLVILLLAALSVVTVMVVQFESFVEPLVVLLAAPLSFAGALALLHLTGTPLNVSSLMGLILLVGLVVKNGIILLDFTRHVMARDGATLGAALRIAGRVRLRPILMTTLCTLFGLLPLALGIGAGSELQRPLALAVIGGLALSTPITLFVVPTFLVAIRGRGYTLAPGAAR